MYSFATPPIKLEQQIGGGLLIVNHLDESLWWVNQKHWASVRSHLLHCFLQVHNAAAPFTSHGNACNYAEPKPFSGAKPADFGFSSSNFTLQDHIPSTAGDALRSLNSSLNSYSFGVFHNRLFWSWVYTFTSTIHTMQDETLCHFNVI